MNTQACEKSPNGNIPTWVVELCVNVSVMWCYFSNENKFIIKLLWISDSKSHLPSSWFRSIVYLSGSYFNKAGGENSYWEWPVTRK